MEEFDLIIKSPGISFVGMDISEFKQKITSQLELLLEFFDIFTIGVTGTKGKSTTSTLIYKMLQDQGKKSILLGNIGVPVFDSIDYITKDTIVVLEMSSHQLEYMKTSPNIAILLNIFQDHLDHYNSFEEYAKAKCNIYTHQKESDYFLYNADNETIQRVLEDVKEDTKEDAKGSTEIKGKAYGVSFAGKFAKCGENSKRGIAESAEKIDEFSEKANSKIYIKDNKVFLDNRQIYDTQEPRKLIGDYILNNIMFVLGVSEILKLDIRKTADTINQFEPLKHRLQLVGKYDGVYYYDNSIATIPEATIEAVKALKNVDTLIIGGMDRGIDYTGLIEFINSSEINNIICMPKTGHDIAEKLEKKTYLVNTMEEAVATAKKVTAKEKSCLLSPAAASYGYFKNFEERGDLFWGRSFETLNWVTKGHFYIFKLEKINYKVYEEKMKKIIYVFGVLFLVIIVVLNVLFTAHLNEHENIAIYWNNFLYIIGLALLGGGLFCGTKKVDNYLNNEITEAKRKKRKIVLSVVCTIFVLLNILWVALVRIGVGADQVHVCNLAQTFYRGDLEEFLPSMTYAAIPLKEYVQGYTQQITLAFIFRIIFNMFHTDLYVVVLRFINIVCNCLTVYGLYKINQQISKKYKTNKVLLFTLILTFFPLIMLSNFIYGDIPSLTLCLFSIYFMMRYTQSKQWKYALVATILTMIAYMMRMNNLIFIIATVIYLLLSICKEFKQTTWKQKGFEFAIILIFIIVSIFPSTLVKNYYIQKLGLDKTKSYPTISYFLMAMSEAPRGNGWYKEEIGEYALKNPEKAREEYPDKIKERLNYLAKNPGYTFKFYTDKTSSMWAENTYSAVCSNISKENDPIQNLSKPLEFYQKAVLLVITICSLIVLIQNRKNLSLEVLFLITIFIGGFAFHILWEAKSRYIIPYIIVLMPVASICINKFRKH